MCIEQLNPGIENLTSLMLVGPSAKFSVIIICVELLFLEFNGFLVCNRC